MSEQRENGDVGVGSHVGLLGWVSVEQSFGVWPRSQCVYSSWVGRLARVGNAELVAAASDLTQEEGPPLASLEDGVHACVMSPMGYVSCPLSPFNVKPCLGRLTTWPSNRPINRRSLSFRCYLHGGCSIAIARPKVDDQLLFQWLLQARVELGTGSARQAELKKERLRLWTTMRPP